ncbi:MAG: 50S ribosomal protein L11 methyltransferase, partial [Bacteroidota bacterium]|nr:50S ribosomal protein L11 methyltransferase [Bacteroidota bacterium]
QENHALNADLAASDMTFVQGDGSACDDMHDGVWDVVCANIHKNVLVADMSRYARTLKEGGHLLLSGFFEGDVHALEASVHASGLEVLGVHVRDGWACMHCGKPLG